MGNLSTQSADDVSDSRERLRRVAELLRKWLAEDGDYDERVWPVLERELSC
jgi:hypothetical protein